jgi:uncharacterized protein YgbK (DUF1537 family)
MRTKKDKLLAMLPPEWPVDLLPTIQAQVRAAGTKIVILDDDPTGGQTIHDVTVLTEGSVDALETVFAESDAVVDVLTNTRSMPLTQAQVITRKVVGNCKIASAATGRDFVVINRSDSTLRGHYPGEVDALIEALATPVDGVLFIPFFLEGGRITANDIHYVTDGEDVIPAAETEYARDTTFAYRNSNLRDWISEKHEGRLSLEAIASISLWDTRVGGPDAVADKLLHARNRQVFIVNATTYRDLEVVVTGLLRAEAAGKRFVYRTAASFVRVRGGIAPSPLLTSADLRAAPTHAGGLIVVGSHVNRTNRQMENARRLPNLTSIEVNVAALLDDAQRDAEIRQTAGEINTALASGHDVMVYTSRNVVTTSGNLTALQIGGRVSSALICIVQRVTVTPAWVIAKGGITASDVATKGIDVRRAGVLGQAIPGVPIWRTGPKSRWPNAIYVVFPGNVGDDRALTEMVHILRQAMPLP